MKKLKHSAGRELLRWQINRSQDSAYSHEPIRRLHFDQPSEGEVSPDDDSSSMMVLTHHNTRVHRFADSSLDHLRVVDFEDDRRLVMIAAARTIIDQLIADKFPHSWEELPDKDTQDWFVALVGPFQPPDELQPGRSPVSSC